jgi:L-malate glycosyltransferase
MAKLAFFWDNFGPLHVDRCEAVAAKFAGIHEVIGLELGSKSNVYDWIPEDGTHFKKITLIQGKALDEISFFPHFRSLLRACLALGRNSIFFMCHSDIPAVLAVSGVLRALGWRVFTMGCSKFDDHQRNLKRELLKSIFFLPYNGAIGSGSRSRDYLRFLGLPATRIKAPYNVVSLDRIRSLAGAPCAPDGVAFRERNFTIIARLVPNKNYPMILKAMKLYSQQVQTPRHLDIYGSGPLEAELCEQVRRDGLQDLVHFHGFLQTAEISQAYRNSIALLLPSVLEPFGNVVPEALAMGLPIVLSEKCGARDVLVRTGVNGFVVESDNPEGLAFFMQLLSENEKLWNQMCMASRAAAWEADSERFAEAVEALITPG